MASNEDLSKYFTGTHEVQECLEGQDEIDLDAYKNTCQKPHAEYIPVNELSVGHLPPAYGSDMCDLIKAMADLTVRIAVKFSSPHRPEFIEGTKEPYPCYDTRGKDDLHLGTGRVREVIKREDLSRCPCPECAASNTHRKMQWMIEVQTARHVVYDEEEIRHSSCRLWFDEKKSPLVKIFGWKLSRSDTNQDLCHFTCVTHDFRVGETLRQMWTKFNKLWGPINSKYKGRRKEDKLTIIVSHPHGCSKQVSVGHWVHREEVKDGVTRYNYTNCTCAGSSGAIVYILGCMMSSGHPHKGYNSETESNYSGLYLDFLHY